MTLVLLDCFLSDQVSNLSEQVMATIIEAYGNSMPSLFIKASSGPPDHAHWNSGTSLARLERLTSRAGLSEKDVLTALALCELLPRKRLGANLQEASAFLLHAAILNLYPLSARRFDLRPLNDNEEGFLLHFSHYARGILRHESYSQCLGPCSFRCNIVDLVDGRVFGASILSLKKYSTLVGLHPSLRAEYHRLAALVDRIRGEKLVSLLPQSADLAAAAPELSGELIIPKASPTESSVMPFHNKVFESHLAPIEISTTEDCSHASDSTSRKVFKELSHWHNSDKIVNDRRIPKKIGFFAHKRHQHFMADMMAYAASLTNSVGRRLEPEIVVVSPTFILESKQRNPKGKETNSSAASSIVQHESGSKSKVGELKKGKKAALAAAAKAQETKAAKKEGVSFALWRDRYKCLQKLDDLRERYLGAQKYLFDLKTTESASLGNEIELYMVSVLISMWIRFCKDKKKDKGWPARSNNT